MTFLELNFSPRTYSSFRDVFSKQILLLTHRTLRQSRQRQKSFKMHKKANTQFHQIIWNKIPHYQTQDNHTKLLN